MHFVKRACFAVIALAIVSAGSASASSTNLAYDELTKLVTGPTPQPGSWDTDYQAALSAANAAANAPTHHGLFGGIQNAIQAGENAAKSLTSGFLTRHYFMNGWERTDDVASQSATIDKPDKHQIIHLDLAKKTYYIQDTSAQPYMEAPPTYARPGPPGPPPPSPQPGTGKLDISVTSTSVGSQTLDNVATTGYSLDFKATMTQATGSCSNGSFETSMLQYLSSYAEPQLAPSGSKPMVKPALPPMAMMGGGQHPGCSPTTMTHKVGGVVVPSGRLALWELVSLKAGSTQGSGSFSTLVERGNVRTLGSSDESLFEIPAGFTQTQQNS